MLPLRLAKDAPQTLPILRCFASFIHAQMHRGSIKSIFTIYVSFTWFAPVLEQGLTPENVTPPGCSNTSGREPTLCHTIRISQLPKIDYD